MTFESNFNCRPLNHLPEFINECERTVDVQAVEHSELCSFDSKNEASAPADNETCVEEVHKIISDRKAGKSTGPDKILNYVIKTLSNTVIVFLTIVFNNCINNDYKYLG